MRENLESRKEQKTPNERIDTLLDEILSELETTIKDPGLAIKIANRISQIKDILEGKIG